jgi:hypothetical protein
MKTVVFNIETESDFNEVDKQINDIVNSTKSLKQQLKELTAATAEATDPESYNKLAAAAGEIKDRIGDARQAIGNFASDTRKLDLVVGSVQGIAGAFAVVQGSVALLAGENEDLQKILVKVQGSLAVLNGVQQVANTLNRSSAVGAALYAAQQRILNSSILGGTSALTGFRAALIATGIGAIIALLGTAIVYWEDLAGAIGLSEDALEKFNAEQDKVAKDLALKLKDSLLDIENQFNVIKKSVDGLDSVTDKITLLAKSFPEFALIDPAAPDALDQINKRLEVRRNLSEQIKEQESILSRLKLNNLKYDELSQQYDEASRDNNKELTGQILEQQKSLLISNATQQDRLAIISQTIAQTEVGITNELAGVKKVSEAQTKADNEAKVRKDNLQKAQEINERNNINLIENRISRELSLIDLKYKTERERAIAVGANIALINRNQELERNNFIKAQQQALADNLLKLFTSVNEDLKKLNLSTYDEDLQAFKLNNAKKSVELRKSIAEQAQLLIGLLKAQGKGDADPVVQSLNKRIASIGITNDEIEVQIQLYNQLIASSDKLAGANKALEASFEANIAIAGLKEVIALQEEILGNEIFNSAEAIKFAREELNIKESLSDLKIILSNKETQIRLENEKKVAEGLAKAGDQRIFNELKVAKNLEDFEATTGKRRTDKQVEYFNRLQQIRNSPEFSEEARLQAEADLEAEFLRKGVEQRVQFFTKLAELSNKSIETQIRINDKFIELEGASADARNAITTQFLQDRRSILGDETLTTAERNDKLVDLENNYSLRILEINRELKRKKLELIVDDPTINPELKAQLLQELLDLEAAYSEKSIQITENTTSRQRDIITSFLREIVSQTDNVLSSFGQLSSASAQAIQQSFEEGKISFAENEKLQKKAFEDQKKIEITRTIISTLSSAQGAFQSQFLPVPDPSSPVRGAIAAGLALTAGFARVAAIRKQQYKSSGAPSANNASLTSQSILRDPGTSQVVSPQDGASVIPSLRVFVTENDITETQRRVRVIQNGSNTTF